NFVRMTTHQPCDGVGRRITQAFGKFVVRWVALEYPVPHVRASFSPSTFGHPPTGRFFFRAWPTASPHAMPSILRTSGAGPGFFAGLGVGFFFAIQAIVSRDAAGGI